MDGRWSNLLAEQIRGERLGNRQFAAKLSSWDFSNYENLYEKMEGCLRTSYFFGLVLSRHMLQEGWPPLEKWIRVVSSDLGLAQEQLVIILKDNVTMPPLLRLQQWIDFRDGHPFEEGLQELLGILRRNIASSAVDQGLVRGMRRQGLADEVRKTKPPFAVRDKSVEHIVSNLFPVVETPREIFSAEARFQTESEVSDACGGPGPLPFVLKGSRIYSLAPLAENSVFAAAVRENARPLREKFTPWLLDSKRATWAIELLDRSLRYHAWKRGLRFEENQNLFYFTRSKPKNLWWEMGGKIMQREVTAPHMQWNRSEDGSQAEVQCGWRHEAIRARFVPVLGNLFLRLEPSWLLTELDGKTPSTSQAVGPLYPTTPMQDQSKDVLRSLRFWSAVLAKGHRELRIDADANPIRVRLTPASYSSQSAASADQVDFDVLSLSDINPYQMIPELGPIES